MMSLSRVVIFIGFLDVGVGRNSSCTAKIPQNQPRVVEGRKRLAEVLILVFFDLFLRRAVVLFVFSPGTSALKGEPRSIPDLDDVHGGHDPFPGTPTEPETTKRPRVHSQREGPFQTPSLPPTLPVPASRP